MGHAVTVQIGVILAREPLDNPWEDHRWRAVDVVVDAPLLSGDWTEHGRVADTVLYHAATLPLVLHRKETPAYRINLDSGEPAVWIVLRKDPSATGPRPVEVHAVSASPHDVQAYGESELESIQSVPMPQPLIALVAYFLDQHHIDEPFVKRQRARHHRPEEEKFGQQPIFARSAHPGKRGGSGDNA
jgi:hypothetical protein